MTSDFVFALRFISGWSCASPAHVRTDRKQPATNQTRSSLKRKTLTELRRFIMNHPLFVVLFSEDKQTSTEKLNSGLYFSGLCGGKHGAGMETEKNVEIDEIDRKILGILISRGRVSFRDLGAQVHLSANATAERVRQLQSANVIRGFHAELDHAKLGLSLQAYIDVRLRQGTSAQNFEALAMKLPGVISAAILTGALDFRLRVACKGQSDLVQLIETLRSRAGVQETNTTVVLRELAGNVRLG